MPGITCEQCGQETFVLSNSIGRRHCTQCGHVLPVPTPARECLMDEALQQEIARAAAAAKPDQQAGGGGAAR